MLAFNVFVAVLLIGAVPGLIAWAMLRPAVRRVAEVCDKIDEIREAQLRREALEREEEARHRARAMREIEEELPTVEENHP